MEAVPWRLAGAKEGEEMETEMGMEMRMTRWQTDLPGQQQTAG